MKKTYQVILSPEKAGGYSVLVPDLDIATSGETVEEGLFMAKDAISLWCMNEQDEGRELPPAVSDVSPEAPELGTMVEVDLDEFRRKQAE